MAGAGGMWGVKIGWKADDGTSAEMLEVGENAGIPGLAKGKSDEGDKKPTNSVTLSRSR